MKTVRQWWKSRTIRWATVIAVLGVAETQFALLQPLLGEYYGLSYVAFAMLMMYLRSETNTSLEKK